MNMSLKSEPQKRSKDRKILIRSKTEPSENQVDLCPRIWSREFSKRSPSHEQGSSSPHHVWSKVWRLCFYCSCLPICYPCYVSRSMRRRKRRTKTAQSPKKCNSVSPHVTSDQCNNLFDTSGDTMGKTMFHRASQRKKDSDESIDVNVVLLRSESSPKLERYLATKRENGSDEVDEAINKFINITRTLTEEPLKNDSSASNGNTNVVRQASSESSNADVGDRKSWKNFMQLQKWKQSFRRNNPQNNRSSKEDTSLHSPVEEKESYTSMKSSINEFFDARSVLSYDEESNYHSLGSLGIYNHDNNLLDCDNLKVRQTKISLVKKTRHDVKPLGTRTVECEGIGYRLQVSIFDEGTITNWSGSDLDQLGSCNIDVVIVIISSAQEVDNLMNLNKGLLHYLGDNWRGFYPLLIVELIDDDEEMEGDSRAFDSPYWYFATLFGDVYKLRMKENELFDSVEWLTDVMGRLYLHSRLYQCSKFYGKGVNNLPECPGGCRLSKINVNKRILPFVRKKVKWKMRSLVKFSKMSSEGQSSVNTTNKN